MRHEFSRKDCPGHFVRRPVRLQNKASIFNFAQHLSSSRTGKEPRATRCFTLLSLLARATLPASSRSASLATPAMAPHDDVANHPPVPDDVASRPRVLVLGSPSVGKTTLAHRMPSLPTLAHRMPSLRTLFCLPSLRVSPFSSSLSLQPFRPPCSALPAPPSLLRPPCSALPAPPSLLRPPCSALPAPPSLLSPSLLRSPFTMTGFLIPSLHLPHPTNHPPSHPPSPLSTGGAAGLTGAHPHEYSSTSSNTAAGECFSWQVDTKYYTAAVAVWTARLSSVLPCSTTGPASPLVRGTEALLLVFDLSNGGRMWVGVVVAGGKDVGGGGGGRGEGCGWGVVVGGGKDVGGGGGGRGEGCGWGWWWERGGAVVGIIPRFPTTPTLLVPHNPHPPRSPQPPPSSFPTTPTLLVPHNPPRRPLSPMPPLLLPLSRVLARSIHSSAEAAIWHRSRQGSAEVGGRQVLCCQPRSLSLPTVLFLLAITRRRRPPNLPSSLAPLPALVIRMAAVQRRAGAVLCCQPLSLSLPTVSPPPPPPPCQPASFAAVQRWAERADLSRFEIRLCVGNKADRVRRGGSAGERSRRGRQRGGGRDGEEQSDFDGAMLLGAGRGEGEEAGEGEGEKAEAGESVDAGEVEREWSSEGAGEGGRGEEGEVRRRQCEEWCADNGIEYVEACAAHEEIDAGEWRVGLSE
ncbi:unnamed protein product [Closterium sp. NIES-65]|nr:unnamed protein product [Closterium sp. NIES-65]